MTRTIAILATATLLAMQPGPAPAQQELDQLQLSAQRVLRAHSLSGDVTTLSTAQVAAIHSIGYSNRNYSERRNLIKSNINRRTYRLLDVFNSR